MLLCTTCLSVYVTMYYMCQYVLHVSVYVTMYYMGVEVCNYVLHMCQCTLVHMYYMCVSVCCMCVHMFVVTVYTLVSGSVNSVPTLLELILWVSASNTWLAKPNCAQSLLSLVPEKFVFQHAKEEAGSGDWEQGYLYSNAMLKNCVGRLDVQLHSNHPSFLPQLCMSFLKLGFITLFLSDALVSGYTAAAAFTVFVTQIRFLFGLDSTPRVSSWTFIHCNVMEGNYTKENTFDAVFLYENIRTCLFVCNFLCPQHFYPPPPPPPPALLPPPPPPPPPITIV